MNDPKLERLIELLERQAEGGGNPSAGISSNRPDNKTYGERVNDLIKSSREASETFKRLNAGLRLTSRAQFEHRMASQEAGEELYRLERAIRDHRRGTKLLTDEQLKEVEARRKDLESTQRQTRAGDMFAGSLVKWGGFLINYFTAVQTATIQGITNVMSTIQAGGSGFAIANAQMAMELDIANVHAQQMGTAMQMAGASIMMLPGMGAKLAGAGVALGGMVTQSASTLRTMAQKAYNQILMTGGEQVLKAYKDLTKAGVIVAGGADAMNQALRGRGGRLVVTFDELSRMAAQNTEELARSRLGVGEATLMMGRIAKVVREQKLERGLLAIGIGLEDFGGIVASTMADMRANNPGRVLKDTEVMAKSLQYAETLALLSSLTGKSVKELKDRGKEAEAELAYQAFIAQLKNPELKQAFDKLPPMVRQSAVEFARFGNVRNDVGRFASQTVPGFLNYIQELAGGLKSNRMTPDMLIDINKKYSKTLNDGILNNDTLVTLAAAGNSKYAGILSELSKIAIEYQGFAGEVEAIKKGIRKQRDEADKGPAPGEKPTMTQTLTDIENAGKTLVANFQGEIIDRIPLIGQLIKDALAKANEMIKGGPEAILAAGQMPSMFKQIYEALIAAGVLAMVGKFVYDRLKGTFGRTETGPKPGTVTTKTGAEAKATAQPSGPRTSSIIDPKTGKPFVMEAGPTQAQLAKAAAAEKELARLAKTTKIAGTTTRVLGVAGAALQVGMTGKEVFDIQQLQKEGKITKDQADIAQTGAVTQGATTLGMATVGAVAGAKLGTFIGAIFAPATAGLSIPIGAALGTLIGGIGGAIVSLLGDWPRKLGESLSKWWKSWTFKGVWDDLGKGLEGIWGSLKGFGSQVSDWTSSGWDWLKGKVKGPQAPANAPAPAAAVPVQVAANLPSGMTVRGGALVVGLAQNDGNWISFSAAGQSQLRDMMSAALRSAQGGPTPAARTSPSVSGLYDPATKKGRVFGETDFQEVGKYDPVVYAIGKLTKIQAEHVELSREVATAMKLNVRQTTESGRYLRSMNRAFQ